MPRLRELLRIPPRTSRLELIRMGRNRRGPIPRGIRRLELIHLGRSRPGITPREIRPLELIRMGRSRREPTLRVTHHRERISPEPSRPGITPREIRRREIIRPEHILLDIHHNSQERNRVILLNSRERRALPRDPTAAPESSLTRLRSPRWAGSPPRKRRRRGSRRTLPGNQFAPAR
jgi:hypothetical protein